MTSSAFISLRPVIRIPLSVLVVEDCAADAKLLIHALEAAGFEPRWTQVETEVDFLAGLNASPELVVADLRLPKFSGMKALALMKECRSDAPLIFVTGESGEENAVAAMLAGAADYLNKDRLARLGGAVRRALERNFAVKKAAASERRFRGLIENSSDAIVLIDAIGIIRYGSPSITRILGYESEAFLGHPIVSFVHEEDRDEMDRLLDESRSRPQEGIDGALRLRHRDGAFRMIEGTICNLLDEPGIHGFVANYRDATERQQGEQKIRFQARMLNLAQDAIVVRALGDRRILFWNKGAERLYGWTAEEALGQLMYERVMPEALDRMVAELMEKGEWRGEMQQIHKDGAEIMVSSRATLVRAVGEEPESMLIINTDITQQKKLESQFLRTQRLESIGTLASGVAHDLNNILSPIMMFAPALRGVLPADKRAEIIELIDGAARRGTDIVRQVLAFASGVEGERLLIDPIHFIDEMAGIARETFPKSIEIVSRYTRGVWPIHGDPTQLHQVLLNLSINARDSMPGGGTITISCETFVVDSHYASMLPNAIAGDYVLIKISDTGTGIPRAIIDRIFDPFFTTKEVGTGTGLGLSTVLGIVKSHGGFMNVSSEEGKGTTFEVFLPAARGDIAADLLAKDIEGPRGHGELVLVVDDEEPIRILTETVLRQSGYEVLTAEDGTHAMVLYTEHRAAIKVVLTDVVMPYFDGVALARALKRVNPSVRIIATTGHSEDSRAATFEQLGVHTFLVKPYRVSNLLGVLHATLAAS